MIEMTRATTPSEMNSGMFKSGTGATSMNGVGVGAPSAVGVGHIVTVAKAMVTGSQREGVNGVV